MELFQQKHPLVLPFIVFCIVSDEYFRALWRLQQTSQNGESEFCLRLRSAGEQNGGLWPVISSSSGNRTLSNSLTRPQSPLDAEEDPSKP